MHWFFIPDITIIHIFFTHLQTLKFLKMSVHDKLITLIFLLFLQTMWVISPSLLTSKMMPMWFILLESRQNSLWVSSWISSIHPSIHCEFPLESHPFILQFTVSFLLNLIHSSFNSLWVSSWISSIHPSIHCEFPLVSHPFILQFTVSFLLNLIHSSFNSLWVSSGISSIHPSIHCEFPLDSHPFILQSILLYTPYISRGFYFHKFRESGAIREFNNTQKLIYLRSRRKNATCVYAILYTVHVQMSEWYWFLWWPLSMIALLLDREFNHSWKCLEVQFREKFDSRNIWHIQYLINPLSGNTNLSKSSIHTYMLLNYMCRCWKNILD